MAEVTHAPTPDSHEPRSRHGLLAAAGAAARETRQSLASVFRNPNLRRVQLALTGSMIGDWAYATAVSVWAYGVGGATAVGVWVAVRMTLMALTSPMTATVADRLPRKAVMIGADLARAVLVAAAAACLYLDTSAWPVFVLATVAALVSTPFRAAQGAIMPALADTPAELTASNGTSSTLESLSFFVGPAIGAALLAVGSVELVFLLNAATFLWSMLLVARIRVPAAAAAPPPDAEPNAQAVSEEPGGGFLAETSAGFRAIWADKDLLLVILEVSVQTIIAGASAVFMVVMAVDILDSGPKGVGYLNSLLGVGAIVGGLVAISRAPRHKLAQDMTTGVVLWSLPLLLVTAWASPVSVFVAMIALGLGNPLVDVNMYTIVQRITPDAVLGRVFGALEACAIGGMALGSALAPLLLHLVGLRGTLALLGGSVALLALAGLPRMRGLDRRLVPPAGLALLRGIDIFNPLAPAVQEALARSLSRFVLPAGVVVLHQGDVSDRFYIIESGRVRVTADEGRLLREEGPGDFFGEIGLLRDVPRTATVTTVEDTVLQALEREDFLGAMNGGTESRRMVEDLVARRLAV
jgi:MFS family permease